MNLFNNCPAAVVSLENHLGTSALSTYSAKHCLCLLPPRLCSLSLIPLWVGTTEFLLGTMFLQYRYLRWLKGRFLRIFFKKSIFQKYFFWVVYSHKNVENRFWKTSKARGHSSSCSVRPLAERLSS